MKTFQQEIQDKHNKFKIHSYLLTFNSNNELIECEYSQEITNSELAPEWPQPPQKMPHRSLFRKDAFYTQYWKKFNKDEPIYPCYFQLALNAISNSL